MKIFLLRHLETSFSTEHRVCGRLDCPLIPDQTLVIPLDILNLMSNGTAKIFTSPMQRCRETTSMLQSLIGVAGIVIIPELAERDWGPLTGMTKIQMEDAFGTEIGLLRNHHPQIESDAQLQNRVVQGFNKVLMQAHETNFIVSHQGCLRIIAQLYGIDCWKFKPGEFRVINI